MRPPRHLSDRKVDDGTIEEIPESAASRSHHRSLNLEACARIRDKLEGRNSSPEVLGFIDGGQGPPSAIVAAPYVEHDVAKMDR
jgi:hypothetical protein